MTNLKNKNYLPIISLAFFVLAFLLVATNPAHAHAIDSTSTVLKNTTSGEGKAVNEVWKFVINLANGLIIIVLLGVAFAQILRLNINTYGVKKILPTLVLSVIAANFSFLFCRLMIDISSVFQNLLLNGPTGATVNPQGFKAAFSSISGSGGSGALEVSQINNTFWYIIAQILKIVGAIFIYILAFLFLIRNWLIYFLVALSPLAMMALVLPATKSLFNQWWSNFLKWVFMPVVSIFWLWLGSKWLTSSLVSNVYLINFVFAGACFYLAITTPFKMGGAIMNAWGNMGKKAWARTGGAAWNSTGGALINSAKEGVNAYYDRQKGHIKNKLWATPAGKAWKQRQYDFRTRNELPGLVAAKREKDARKLAMLRMYRRHNDKKDKFDLGDAASRVKAELRVAEGDEANSTYNTVDVQGVLNELGRLNALDASGKLKTEAELLQLGKDSDDYILIHGLIKRMGALRNNSATRDEARRVFGGITKERRQVNGKMTDVDVPNDGLFGSVEEANRAFSRDFAGGVRDKDNPLGKNAKVPPGWQGDPPGTAAGISPVGAHSNGVVDEEALHVILDKVEPEAADKLNESLNLIGEENMREMAQSAMDGKSFEDYLAENGESINFSETSPEDQRMLQEAFETLGRQREKIDFGTGKREGEATLENVTAPPETKAKLEGVIGKDATDRLVATATHYKTSFEKFIQESGINYDELDEGTQAILKQTFDSLRAGKDKLVDEAATVSEAEVEDKMVGIREVFTSLSSRGMKLPQLRQKINEAQRLFEADDLEGANAIVGEISASLPKFDEGRKDEFRRALGDRLKHLDAGAGYFKDRFMGVEQIADPKEKQKEFWYMRNMMRENPADFMRETEQSLRADARRSAETTVATRVALANVASNSAIAGLSIDQFMDKAHPERMELAIDEFLTAAHGLKSGVAGGLAIDKDEITKETLGLSTEAVAERQAAREMMTQSIRDGLNAVLKNPSNVGMSAQSALTDEALMKAVYKGIDKAARSGAPLAVKSVDKPAAVVINNSGTPTKNIPGGTAGI